MKRKVMHKLFYQVVLYFAAIVLVFAALMSVIFIRTYENDSYSAYNTFLENQIAVITERMQKYVESGDIDDYTTYMQMMEDAVSADVWVLSNKAAKKPLSEELVNIDISDHEMSIENKQVLKEAYLGRTIIKEGYSKVMDENVITIGAPIYSDENKTDVAGAVLLLDKIEPQEEDAASIKMMFGISILIAMLVAFVLAALFARRLCRPIMKINETTKELADGKYGIETYIKDRNEIGELAHSVDILADRLRENELQRAYMEQMRKDFFSNISHELRTPITVIRAYLESLVDGVVGGEKIPAYYNRMLNECNGMQRLIEDLLLLSKMENPEFTIELEPVNIVQVFDDIVRSFRVVCAKKNIKIEIDSDTECRFINGDYDRIRQVFIAILDNAIKFSYENSAVYIKIRTSGKIIISIRDEGVGIEKEELTHIFDRFYTKKTNQNKNGSGLGLVIAKEMVKKHNGTIEVKSEVGKGTEFILAFDQIMLDESYD